MIAKKKQTKACIDGCANASSGNLWFIGVCTVVLVIIFALAMFNIQDSKPVNPNQIATQPVAFGQGFMGFDGGMGMGYPDQVLPNSPGFGVAAPCPPGVNCFPMSGGVQQVAVTQGGVPPACATCPSVTNCFPQAGGAQQVALTTQGGVPPACATCPSVTNCFPQAAGQQIALTKPIGKAPPIFRDAIMPHGYRGVCSNCHIINPDVPIQANSQMPHEYRGVCSNCHTILGAAAGAK